ncbi:MAG: energy-coupling factor transporter transmembrane component T [Eubacteriales bacterium]|nr:energy-coupling factor transporter transmembrane component T [Eubacteriales bacterium]
MGFESYHPMINFLYFAAAIICAIWFNHPVFAAIAWLCAFVFSVKRNGIRMLVGNICLLAAAFIYSGWYSYYHHFGVTKLRVNFIGNAITLEAVLYGLQRGITVITVVMIMSCVFSVVSSDKVVYLFGRISPKLSLFFSILLRSIPKIKVRAEKIRLARAGIGKDISRGNIWKRIVNLTAVFSILITWISEEWIENSASMKSRGYSLKGRTAFSIYRFDNRDRFVVLLLFFCYTTIIMAAALDQTHIYYSPEIIWNHMTFMSGFFYGAYALFLMLPVILELYGTWKHHKAAKEGVE